MRRYIVTAALAAAGIVATSGWADAQHRRGSRHQSVTRYYTPYGYTGGYYAPYSSSAVGGWGQAYAPGTYAYQPSYGYDTTFTPGSVYYGDYPSAGYVQPDNTSVIRSLYLQYLGREPDPAGFQYWSGRLAGTGGNVALITQDFAAAAQNERAGYPQGYNPAFRSYYGFR